MNIILTEYIIKHILCGFKVIDSLFIDNRSKSLLDNNFLLKEKLLFTIDENLLKNNIWGCLFRIEDNNIKIILGDVSRDSTIKEYCLIIHLHNSPIYGLYIINDNKDTQALIAHSQNGDEWSVCNMYLQATFLAGMEYIKDYLILPEKCFEYALEYKAMLSFINFHSKIFEDNDEG